jgi:hypothetical protein
MTTGAPKRAFPPGALLFDTRQYNHIKWSAPADLRKQLAERIKATVQLPARL